MIGGIGFLNLPEGAFTFAVDVMDDFGSVDEGKRGRPSPRY